MTFLPQSLALASLAAPSQDAPASQPAMPPPPRLEVDARFRAESGNGRTDRVTIWGVSAGAEVALSPQWRLGASEAYIVYSNIPRSVDDFVASARASYAPSDDEAWSLRLDFHSAMESSQAWAGGAGVAKALSDEITLVAHASRDVVEDSMLSAAGEPVNGSIAGQVRADRLTLGIDARPFERVEAYARLSGGVYEGLHVRDNATYGVDYGVGVEVLEREPWLRLGYASSLAGYRHDESGFFTQPSPSGAEPGGYFSPKFTSRSEVRVDLACPIAESTRVRAGAGVGYEVVDDATHDVDDPRATTNAAVRVEHGLLDRVLGFASFAYDNGGAARNERRFVVGLRVEF